MILGLGFGYMFVCVCMCRGEKPTSQCPNTGLLWPNKKNHFLLKKINVRKLVKHTLLGVVDTIGQRAYS